MNINLNYIKNLIKEALDEAENTIDLEEGEYYSSPYEDWKQNIRFHNLEKALCHPMTIEAVSKVIIEETMKEYNITLERVKYYVCSYLNKLIEQIDEYFKSGFPIARICDRLEKAYN